MIGGECGEFREAELEPCSMEGIAVSTRLRIARNIRDVAFPGWAGEDELLRLYGRLKGIVVGLPCMAGGKVLDMGTVSAVERELLREQHLISRELAERGLTSGAVLSADERVCVMINEEDHLRLQVIAPDMDLDGMWKQICELDDGIDACVDYAFSSELGYLTSCPTNVGTGLRVSVMLHLPALRLLGEVEGAVKGLNRIGMDVRGSMGEGSDMVGGMLQVSNRSTLGESEESILARLRRIVQDLVCHERNARERLVERKKSYLLDHVGRAIGVLSQARLLSSNETADLLSALKLGMELRCVRGASQRRISELMLLTQPGHLQEHEKRILSPEERDEVRATVVRARIKGVSVQEPKIERVDNE